MNSEVLLHQQWKKKTHLNECLVFLLYTAEKTKSRGYRYPEK